MPSCPSAFRFMFRPGMELLGRAFTALPLRPRNELTSTTRELRKGAPLLQLRVLGLRLLKNGNIGFRVFPQRQEILIGAAA